MANPATPGAFWRQKTLGGIGCALFLGCGDTARHSMSSRFFSEAPPPAAFWRMALDDGDVLYLGSSSASASSSSGLSARGNIAKATKPPLGVATPTTREAVVVGNPQAIAILRRSVRFAPHVRATHPAGTDREAAYLSALSGDDLDALALWSHSAREHEEGERCGSTFELVGQLPLHATLDPYTPALMETQAVVTQVREAVGQISGDEILASIQTWQDLGTRYHRRQSGLDVPTQIADRARSLSDRFRPELITHDNSVTDQKSTVVSLPGTVDDKTTVIIGAHLDSINRSDVGVAPGADDDASGMAVAFETMRVIAKMGLTFSRRVEWHFYAAEEIGLAGSLDVAERYRKTSRRVASMMQLDMTGFTADPSNLMIQLVTNDTSTLLRSEVLRLGKNYLADAPTEGTLPSGTSDHRSWYNQGFQTVFPFERIDSYNKTLHTAGDTVDRINPKIAVRFAELALAYLSHFAGLRQAEAIYKDLAAQFPAQGQLKIALQKTAGQEEDVFDIFVAAPKSAFSLAGCLGTGEIGTDCERPVTFTLVGLSNQRSFFAAPGTRLTGDDAGESLALAAQSSAGDAVATRRLSIVNP